MTIHTFNPDWVSAPGDSISRLMSRNNQSVESLSQNSGFSIEYIEKILLGHNKITRKFAEAISNELGGNTDFWMKREKEYRNHKADLTNSFKSWVNEFPYADLSKFGWVGITKSVTEKYHNLLDYFSSDSIGDWENKFNGLLTETSYRVSNSFDSKALSVVSWLNRAEVELTESELGIWDPVALEGKLEYLKSLTRTKDPAIFVPLIKKELNIVGVSMSIIPTPSGCALNGATYTSKQGNPVIILSSRYLSDDQFWFTFFHEVAHVLLHLDRGLILEGGKTEEAIEHEADKFASNLLIPKEFEGELFTLSVKNWKKIPRFAKKIGVSSGIILGQLQFKKLIPPSHLNKLKTRYKWSKDNQLNLKN